MVTKWGESRSQGLWGWSRNEIGNGKKSEGLGSLIIGSSRMARLSWEIRKELRVPPGDVETMDKA
jgi:hypothetical protein